MRLFSHPASPNCVAVIAAAQRLGSDLDVQHVDLFSGAAQSRIPGRKWHAATGARANGFP